MPVGKVTLNWKHPVAFFEVFQTVLKLFELYFNNDDEELDLNDLPGVVFCKMLGATPCVAPMQATTVEDKVTFFVDWTSTPALNNLNFKGIAAPAFTFTIVWGEATPLIVSKFGDSHVEVVMGTADGLTEVVAEGAFFSGLFLLLSALAKDDVLSNNPISDIVIMNFLLLDITFSYNSLPYRILYQKTKNQKTWIN